MIFHPRLRSPTGCTSLLLAAILLAGGCRQVRPSENGLRLNQYAFVTNGKSSNVSVVDLTTFRVVRTVPVGSDPSGVTASPIRNEVYVVNTGSGSVSVLNAETLQVASTVRVGRSPFSLELSPDGVTGFVANSASDTVSVVNLTARRITKTIPVGRSPGS